MRWNGKLGYSGRVQRLLHGYDAFRCNLQPRLKEGSHSSMREFFIKKYQAVLEWAAFSFE